jgi:hypothetical protein
MAELSARGVKIVISQRPPRRLPMEIDEELYKSRHLIESFFCKFKDFKRMARRAGKTDYSFDAIIYLVSSVINSR